MNIIAIVQARMSSTRLPGKVLKPLAETSVIKTLYSRLSLSKEISSIIISISSKPSDDKLAAYLEKNDIKFFRGSEQNVLDRFFHTAQDQQADVIVRVTGDCPLIDSGIVDTCILNFKNEECEYYSNVCPPTFPDGLDVEVFSKEILHEAWENAKEKYDLEHVTPYIIRNSKTGNLFNDINYSKSRWTLDTEQDYQVIKNIFNEFDNISFEWNEIVDLEKKKPNLFNANKSLIRNEGAKMKTGQKLWMRAKNIIPGGNHLLSKRPEMFLPDHWPAYFKKTSGINVWDLDDNKFVDFSIMGIGTNTLGYNHPKVDAAVMQAVKDGNMSTLNCPEEVYVAEKLVEIHPWAEMVRFARSGGEANSIAIRIARASSGKDGVAFCGYHGWHDWYLSANLLSGDALDKHHLSGLDMAGVPKQLKGTSFPFSYNNLEELKAIIDTQDIGVIKMEVMRSDEPQNDFLLEVRKLATQKNIVLIFDECTSGFRKTFGGLHKYFDVSPDIAMFGKTLGNGYAITSVIGTREVMESAQKTFISSTFWTERIGSVAALATLTEMERIKSYQIIDNQGRKIKERWKKIFSDFDIPIKTFGLDALACFEILLPGWNAAKTLITQEMLKKGYLAGNSVYVCILHTDEEIDLYFNNLFDFLSIYSSVIKNNECLQHLEGPEAHTGFKRLN